MTLNRITMNIDITVESMVQLFRLFSRRLIFFRCQYWFYYRFARSHAWFQQIICANQSKNVAIRDLLNLFCRFFRVSFEGRDTVPYSGLYGRYCMISLDMAIFPLDARGHRQCPSRVETSSGMSSRMSPLDIARCQAWLHALWKPSLVIPCEKAHQRLIYNWIGINTPGSKVYQF